MAFFGLLLVAAVVVIMQSKDSIAKTSAMRQLQMSLSNATTDLGVDDVGKKKRTFDPRINIMKYKSPWNAPKSSKDKWDKAVEETWRRVRQYPMGGKPLRKFIHENVQNLTKLREELFAWVPEEL